jgi:MFS family permease
VLGLTGTDTASMPAPTEHATLQRRTLRVLVVGQVLGGLGLAAGVSVGALLARDLLDGDALTGIPLGVATAGGAFAALPLSRLMDARGRRPGLALGYALGALGAAVVVAAAAAASFALLVAGMALFGAGNTSSLLARYAGADLAPADRRGRAVSTVLFATTFGAVAGPNLVDATGSVASALGLPVLAGPFLLSLMAYGTAAAVVAVALRPDPLLAARAATRGDAGAVDPARPGGWSDLFHGPALVAVAAMVTAQLVMVSVMTMTPVHMRAHDHGLRVIGLTISAHIAGMYLFSPVVGLLCDRLGRPATLRLGALTLAAAGGLAALADPASSVALVVALFLLGLGWSLSLIAGSAGLTDAIAPARRARVQGNADLLIGLAGATGGLGSGVVLALTSFAVLAGLAAAAAAGLLAAGWFMRGAGASTAARPST